MRRALELRLLVVALLAALPIPCGACGWPTSADRRQLELELEQIAPDVAGELGYADPVCDACARRGLS